MLRMKLICLLLAFGSPFAVACTAHEKAKSTGGDCLVDEKAKSTADSRDAKVDTKVMHDVLINSPDKYKVSYWCVEGEHHVMDGRDCFISNGEKMEIKIKSIAEDSSEKVMIYQVTAHNDDYAYRCDDKGAIERGYAATFQEIVLGVPTIDMDICTTVTDAGHNTTEAKLTVTETGDGVFIRFENSGCTWVSVGDFAPTTGDIKVDFNKIPE